MGIFGFGERKNVAQSTEGTPSNVGDERVNLSPEEARKLRDKYRVPFDGGARLDAKAGKIDRSAPVTGAGAGGLETNDMDPAARRGVSEPPMAA